MVHLWRQSGPTIEPCRCRKKVADTYLTTVLSYCFVSTTWTMPPDPEGDNSVGRRRRRIHSTSSSPEPYTNRRSSRRSSRRRRARDSPDSESRSRERYARHRRRSYSPERSWRDRSQSPRGRHKGRERYKRHRWDDEAKQGRPRQDHWPSPQSAARRLEHSNEQHRNSAKRSRALPSQQDAFKGGSVTPVDGTLPDEKIRPNFSTTGRLAVESNTIKSADGQAIVLKYHEPPEARKPLSSDAWRMYVFKGSEIVETLQLSRRSCWLFGREAAVVDHLIEHPSCSKQHAVVQFRYIEKKNEYGDKNGKVRPYLIDLESANGTSMNGEQVPAKRYLELRDKDIIKFGHSTREYVLQLPP